MAYYKKRSHYRGGRSSSYSTPTSNTQDREAWEPVCDKNPVYRTHSIFCRVHRYKLQLIEAKQNYTTPHAVHLRVDDPIDQQISEDLGYRNERYIYRMACGHLQKLYPSQKGAVGEIRPCHKCGEKQGYWVLHHEHGHHWFDSFNPLIPIFVDQCAEDYSKLAPQVGKESLKQFLMLTVNLFDDLRNNSLLWHVMPGAAEQLDIRWKRLTEDKKNLCEKDFMQFAFAVALEVDAKGGEFEPLRPILDWTAKAVRGKAVDNMCYALRVMLDRCIGTLISHIPPDPPQDDAADQGDADDDQNAAPGGQGTPSGHAGGKSLPNSSSAQGASSGDLAQALQQLMQNNNPHDPLEKHHQLTDLDLARDPKARNKAMQIAAAIMGKDLQDTAQMNSIFTQTTDQKSQQQLGQLQKDLAQVHTDSQLSSDAKARILFIDVPPAAIPPDRYVDLSPFDEERVARLQGVFNRIMGQKKLERSRRGPKIDIRAFIRYLTKIGLEDGQALGGSTGNEKMFKKLLPQRGFAYFVLVDMSGSMSSCFQKVAEAAEILKRALDFPFVTGSIWGFQGGYGLNNITGQTREPPPGEVWLFRYHPECMGYEGEVTIKLREGIFPVSVQCNGITPMNSALRVAVKNFIINYPPSVAKQKAAFRTAGRFDQACFGKPLHNFRKVRFRHSGRVVDRRHHFPGRQFH